MRRNQKLSLIVASTLLIATLSAVPLHAAIGQHTSAGLLEGNPTLLAISWSEIWDKLKRQEVPGGSRGARNQPTVCAVVPGMLVNPNADVESSLQVWDVNPVFIWQGAWSRLEVFRSRDHEVLLSQALTPEARNLVYSDVEGAIELEPGGSYYWKLSRDGSDGQEPTFGETSFRTFNEEDRLTLETELAKALGSAGSPEEVLSQRVNFFVEQGLWADALRELHAADELPADLETVHDFCEQPSEITLVP